MDEFWLREPGILRSTLNHAILIETDTTGVGVWAIKVHVLNMGIADNSPMGKLMITILATFAEFERDVIVERTQSGRAMAREKNAFFVDGRPPKYSRKQIAYALDLLKDNSYKTVSEITGISVSTLQRARCKQNI